jgi:predicted enzyme related to lactoylglutathione lyase
MSSEAQHPIPPKHGQPSYLQIPAIDLAGSSAFYEAVFGWRIERPYPSFEAPGLIGQWVTERPPAPGAGPLLWINVESMDVSLGLVEGNGGRVIEPPAPDGPNRWLATVADPAGNAIGIVQHDRAQT